MFFQVFFAASKTFNLCRTFFPFLRPLLRFPRRGFFPTLADYLIHEIRTMSKEFIRIGGAREHNLKNLTLEIPRDKLVVITGLSGQRQIVARLRHHLRRGPAQIRRSRSPPTRASSSTRCRSRTWISSRAFRRPSPSSSAVPAPARAPSSPPPRRFTITCACFTRTSASRIARKPACPIVTQTTSDIVDKILALPPKNARHAARAGRARAERRVPRRGRAPAREGFRPRARGRRTGRTRPPTCASNSTKKNFTPSKPSWTGW